MSLEINNTDVTISIVVPVYNGATYIDQCLHSLQESLDCLSDSKKQKIEIIVCDNHSTDSTLEIVKNYQLECIYRVIQTPEHYPNRTLNWRYGLNECFGTWIMMLHADDLIAPRGLVSLLSAVQHSQNLDVVMISGQIRTFTDEFMPSRLRPFWPLPALINGESMRQQILPFLCPFVPFTLMQRDAYLKLGGLNNSYELVQDWEFWIRLLGLGDLYYYPHEIGWWRNHDFSEKYATIFAKEHFTLSQQLQVLIPELPPAIVQDAVELQIAKIKNWMSKFDLNTDDRICIDNEIIPISLSLKNAKQRLKINYYSIGIKIYWLRLIGSFYLLKQKFFAG